MKPRAKNGIEHHQDFLLELGTNRISRSLQKIIENEAVSNFLIGAWNSGIKPPTINEVILMLAEIGKIDVNKNLSEQAELQRKTIMKYFHLPNNAKFEQALIEAGVTVQATPPAQPVNKIKRPDPPKKAREAKTSQAGNNHYTAFIEREDITASPTFLEFLKMPVISNLLKESWNEANQPPSIQEISTMFKELDLNEDQFTAMSLIFETLKVPENKKWPVWYKARTAFFDELNTIQLKSELTQINEASISKSSSSAAQPALNNNEEDIFAAVPDLKDDKNDIDPQSKEAVEKSKTSNSSEPFVNPLNSYLFSEKELQKEQAAQAQSEEAKIPNNPSNSVESRKIIMPINIQNAVGFIKNQALKDLLQTEENLQLLTETLDETNKTLQWNNEKIQFNKDQDLATFLERLLNDKSIISKASISYLLAGFSSKKYDDAQIQKLSGIIYTISHPNEKVKESKISNSPKPVVDALNQPPNLFSESKIEKEPELSHEQKQQSNPNDNNPNQEKVEESAMGTPRTPRQNDEPRENKEANIDQLSPENNNDVQAEEPLQADLNADNRIRVGVNNPTANAPHIPSPDEDLEQKFREVFGEDAPVGELPPEDIEEIRLQQRLRRLEKGEKEAKEIEDKAEEDMVVNHLFDSNEEEAKLAARLAAIENTPPARRPLPGGGSGAGGPAGGPLPSGGGAGGAPGLPPAAPAAAPTGSQEFDGLISFLQRENMLTLSNVLLTANVRNILVDHWNTPGNYTNAKILTMINSLVNAGNSEAARTAIANLTNPPTALLTALNTPPILDDTSPSAALIRREAIYYSLMSDRSVHASPQLHNFLESPHIKTALFTHWNNFTNVAPVMARIPDLITALTANPAPTAAAVRTAFNDVFGPVALPEQTFNDQLALIRGSAPYNTFVTSANFLNMPQTFQVIIQSPAIKDILTRHWSTNTPPTDINTLLESLDPELGLNAETTRRAIANAFGNPPGLVAALAGAGIEDNDHRFQHIKDQAKGFILVEELLENPAIAAIPEIKALFEADNNAAARRLATHFGANPPNMRTLPTAIVAALASAGDDITISNVFNTPDVFGINLNIPLHSITPQSATLRGKARLQQLLSEEKNTAILNDMPALARLLDHLTLKDGVINDWGRFGHGDIVGNRIVELRDSLAVATTVLEVQTAFHAFSPGADAHITAPGTIDTALVTTLRNQARKSKAENEPEVFKTLRKNKIKAIKKIGDDLLLADIRDARTLQSLNTSIERIINNQHLNTNHELYQAALRLQEFFTRDAAGQINGIDLARQTDFLAALETAKAAQQKLMNSADLLYKTNANIPDEGLKAYRDAAKYYKQQTLKNPDEEESKRIEAICYKMQDDLELAESKILERIEDLEENNPHVGLYSDPQHGPAADRMRAERIEYRNEMLDKIKKCRADLKETIGNIEENRALQTNAKKVNCYSDQSELVENSNERIMEKVIAYQQHGATPRSANNGVMSARVKAEIAHTKPFGAKARVNYTELTNRDGSTARFVSVQRTQGKLFKSELYHNPQDFETLDTLNLIKLAAREVENFYAAIPENKGYRLNLQGNMHPKFADAIIGYCKLKGYPKPFSSIPKYEPTNNSRYHRHFEDIYKQNKKQILTNTGDVSHIALTKESVDKLDKTVGAPPAEQPPRP